MDFKETELSKKDWQNLIEYGLVDTDGNGFASTTEKADDTLHISSAWNTFVRLKGKQTIFVVRYYDGCFYPIWHKLYATTKQLKGITVFSK